MKYIFITLVTLLLIPQTALFGQKIDNPALEIFFSDQLEQLLENAELEDFDVQERFEQLQYFYSNPVDLNGDNLDRLLEIGLINELQLNAIIAHRRAVGDFVDVLELQSVKGITMAQVKLLASFVGLKPTFKASKRLWDHLKEGDNRLFLRWQRTLESQSGFLPDEDGRRDFQGDPNRLYLQFLRQSEYAFSAGITLEKDPGEPLDSRVNTIDHSSFHLYYNERDKGNLRQLAIGDYNLSLGQGLLINTGFATGKSSYTMDIKRSGRAIRAFRSVNENQYLRGAAATMEFGSIQTTAFISRANRDGNIEQLADTTEEVFTSLQLSGLHRTESEIADRKQVGHFTAGGSVGWKKNGVEIRLNHIYNRFNRQFDRSESLANLFAFEGEQLHNFSIDYSWPVGRTLLFGENALSDNGAPALLNGLLTTFSRFLDVSVVHRYISPEYQSFFSSAFIESSNVVNEEGLYIGLQWQIAQRWQLRGYADHWRYPWLRFRVNAPSRGREYLGRLTFNIRKKLEMYLQYRYEEKGINEAEPGIITNVANQRRQNWRFQIAKKVNSSWEWRSRIEFVLYDRSEIDERGLFVFQDILYRPIQNPLSFTARLGYFDTDSFNSRVFSYENNVLNAYAIPSFSGEGIRTYINIRYSPTNLMTIEGRYALTYFLNPNSFISSGRTLIEDNQRTELTLQLRLKF